MVWWLDGARAWMSRASPENPAAGGSPHDSGAACSIFRPRWCWRCAVAAKRPGPDHRPRRAGPGAKARSRGLRRTGLPAVSAWVCCCWPGPRLCSGGSGAPGCGPRCWPPRPRVYMAAMGGHWPCSGRVAGSPFSRALNGDCRARGGLPLALGLAHAHRHHRGAGLAARSGLLFAVAICDRVAPSRLQDRSVRQKRHPHQRAGRRGDRRWSWRADLDPVCEPEGKA